MPFEQLGLKAELVRAVSAQGYARTTPIQAKTIPLILEGRDVLAGAQTGTGKTAAFTLPLLQRLDASRPQGRHPRALILTPTRELAAQVAESVATYGRFLALRHAVVFGGVGFNPQAQRLRRGVDVLVATPGRLLDHVGQGTVNLSHIEILVLDEADRMLDMGFIHDIPSGVRTCCSPPLIRTRSNAWPMDCCINRRWSRWLAATRPRRTLISWCTAWIATVSASCCLI